MTRAKPDASVREGRSPRLLVCAVVLSAVVAGVFSNTLTCGFNYDDEANIIENPHYRGLDSERLAWMFTTFHMGHYQPLSWVSLAVDYLIWGEDPFGYHLTNLVLHTLNSLLVLLIALALLGGGQPRQRLGWPVHLSALLAALIWAVHPLRVESVAWITERRDVLSSFFLLMSVWSYLRAHGGATNRPARWVILSLSMFALSLLSRAMGVTLPVILLLLDWYPLRRLGHAAVRASLEKIPYLLLAIGFAVVAPLAQQTAGAAIPLEEHGLLARVAQSCHGLVFYIVKTIVPHGLAPLYFLDTPLDVWSAKYLPPAGLVVLALLALPRYGRRWPWLTVVVATYAVLLGPVLGFVQSGRQEVADRYSYLPAIGWALLAGGGLLRLWQRPRSGLARAATALGLLIVAALGVQTWRQNLIWKNPETLWTHAVRRAPSPVSHQNLGAALAKTGRLEQAIEHYQSALALEPLHEKSLHGLAKALTDVGRLDQAAETWEQVLLHQPGNAKARFQYANVQRARGYLDAAAREYTHVLQAEPDSLEARVNLGGVYLDQGRLGEAEIEFRAALSRKPDHADARYNLGNALARAGRYAEAVVEYEAALHLRPDFAEAGNNLAIALERLDRLPDAITAYRDVLGARPHHVIARYNLARVLAATGARDEAVAELRELLRRQPDHAAARRALDTLQTGAPGR